MIRIRVERQDPEDFPNGLVWYHNGMAVGRVIIEQTETMGPFMDYIDPDWEPVEVVGL